jgi:hypothetical protein
MIKIVMAVQSMNNDETRILRHTSSSDQDSHRVPVC